MVRTSFQLKYNLFIVNKFGVTKMKSEKRKPTFNKDKSRFKKNYGSMQEGHGLAFLQKKSFKQNYITQKKKEEFTKKKSLLPIQLQSSPNSKEVSKSILDDATSEEREVFDALPNRTPKPSKFKRAQQEFKDIQEDKVKMREEKGRKRQEIEEKRKKYKEKKLFRNIKLSQKTRKGQPLMKARMELLLTSILETLAKEQK